MPVSPSERLAIWRKAIPMQNARFAFAPAELKDRWRALWQQSAMGAMKRDMEDAKERGQVGAEFFQTAVAGAQVILGARGDLERDFERILLDNIRKGALRSFGFEAPRTVSSEPLELGAEFWLEDRRWSTGELRAQSLRFVEVRLLPAKRAIKISEAVLSPKRGRPTVVPDIEAAFASLLEAGKIDLKAPRRAHFSAIREWMRAHRPDATQGSDKPGGETIRRVIAPLIDAARLSRSPKQ